MKSDISQKTQKSRQYIEIPMYKTEDCDATRDLFQGIAHKKDKNPNNT